MNKNIWIWNHYATKMFKDKAGRHYWFADNLIKSGHNATIFCASTIHNSNESIDVENQMYTIKQVGSTPFVFVKTPPYLGNGITRIRNMVAFYKNLYGVSKEYAKEHGKPDVIIASSVHPLTLLAGIKIAKKFNIPCICEIRDLWPESIVEYGSLKRTSAIARILYLGEKWIYKNADKLIFTMEGGRDYIIQKGWAMDNGGPINLNKVHHINNGLDLAIFNYNKDHHMFSDDELSDKDYFKVVYTGSIRKVNNVEKIVNVARYVKKLGYEKIKFFIFGDGPEREKLENICFKDNINNVSFKGSVEKNMIPYILNMCDLNIMHFDQNNLKKYGASLNKMFEYFASARPILSDCEFGYDLIKKHNCGIVVDNADAKSLAETIIGFSKMPKENYQEFCDNAKKAAHEYDFKVLTSKLESLL